MEVSASKRNKSSRNNFVKSLLADMRALEHMLDHAWFEKDITRIGAEQEIVLIDKDSFRPSTLAMQILEENKEAAWLVNELAQFNLELNLAPQIFEGSCLSMMHRELQSHLDELRISLHRHNIDYLLTGILPTLKKYHLDMHYLTPKPRYKELMNAIHGELRNTSFELRLVGIDELLVRHDSPLLEACNTSFQVHLQVAPAEFVNYYNCALVMAAPSIAISANSPMVFGKRLWHETRIALFQQSIDTRKTLDHMRQLSPRVILGDRWLKESVLEIFREDIARFRILLHAQSEEDSQKLIRNKIVPKLKSLQLHNSTVYRWNRPCYGISDTGKPHLRIENRVFPSGPTILDEISNMAFWLGCMRGLYDNFGDITKQINFEDIRDNFGKSARFGIDSNFTWFKDSKINAGDLVLKELLPLARKGLESQSINSGDIDLYLGIIEERAKMHMNGARWQLRSYTKLLKEASSPDDALTTLTAAIYDHQNRPDHPITKWPEPNLEDLKEYKTNELRVSEFMQTDLYTAHKNDLVELVSELMRWQKLKYMLVEDSHGNLVGLISLSDLFGRMMEEKEKASPKDLLVRDVMIPQPFVVGPDDNIKKAVEIMKKNDIGCLPVVKDKELLGLVTTDNVISITNRMMKER